jgi:helix-turn-helix protein
MISIPASTNNLQDISDNLRLTPADARQDDQPLSPDEEAFMAYRETWRQELEENWTGGYAQMPNEIRQDRSLSHKAKEVYEQLLSYMWFKTDRCWPSQTTLAEATGYSRRSIVRALNELYERGYIEKWRRGLGLTNYYFINPLSFVRSFRPLPGPRTVTHLPFNAILPSDAPELRQDIGTAQPRPAQPVSLPAQNPEVPNSHTGNAKNAQQETPNWHTKHTKAKSPDSIKEEENSNGVAIELGGQDGTAVAAIRNQTEPKPETERTEESLPQHTNLTQPTENRKEEEAMSPADLQNEQGMAERYRKTPRLTIEGFVRQYVPLLNDHQAMQEEKFMQSNITRAINLFEKRGVWTQEEIAEVMGKAFNDARKFPGEIEAVNEDDKSENRMRFFYYRLGKRVEKLVPGTSPTVQGRPAPKSNASRSSNVAVTPRSGMSQAQAEALAVEISLGARALGVTTEVRTKEGVSIVVLTWRGISMEMLTADQWKATQPLLARREEKKRQEEQGASHATHG